MIEYQMHLPIPEIEEDMGIAMTTCANCNRKIPQRDAIPFRTKLEDFCSMTCQADYNRF